MADLLGETVVQYATSSSMWTVQRALLPPEEILHIFKSKAIDKEWSFEECKPSDTGKWTHDYHRYPAKFIPQLVERLIGWKGYYKVLIFDKVYSSLDK